jgi:hypothetical protein
MDWDCPTWGCKGGLFTDGQPRPDEAAWCERWPGTVASHCGQRMRWDADREVWRPLPTGSLLLAEL